MTYHRPIPRGTEVTYQMHGESVPGVVLGYKDINGHFVYVICTAQACIETTEDWITPRVH
ncbi:MAG: hypothetical protein AMXMBFR44_2380 [Candidatus Campbellbacteria bacterium]